MSTNKNIYNYNIVLLAFILLIFGNQIYKYTKNKEFEKTVWNFQIESLNKENKLQIIDFQLDNELGVSSILKIDNKLLLKSYSSLENIQGDVITIFPNKLICNYYSFNENKFYKYDGILPYEELLKNKEINNLLVFEIGNNGQIDVILTNHLRDLNKVITTLKAKVVNQNFKVLLTNYSLKNIEKINDYKDILTKKINIELYLQIDSISNRSLDFFGDNYIDINTTNKIDEYPKNLQFTWNTAQCINKVDYTFDAAELIKVYRSLDLSNSTTPIILNGKLTEDKKEFYVELTNGKDSIRLIKNAIIECL